MDDIVKKLIDALPESPTALTDKNKKKIHEYIPVPSEDDILWADIQHFGGYPCGVVLTDRGITFKAPRSVVKAENARRSEKLPKKKQAKRDKKERKQEEQPLQTIYQIIPWEYYEPSAYKIEKRTNGKQETYVIKINDTELTEFSSRGLYRFFINYEQEVDRIEQIAHDTAVSAAFTSLGTVDLENTAFNAAYGADQSKTGHGSYAEDAGVLIDRLHLHRASAEGRVLDATGKMPKNGPDKIVDGIPIQCKYCRSAGESVKNCFKKDPVTGAQTFRYYRHGFDPMLIEVPKDQYADAVKAMKRRIEQGQVPGVTDPAQAEKIIRPGRLTYAQARNLAKAGTFESLKYDAVTGVVSCSAVCGISALVSFGIAYWQTGDIRSSAKAALYTGAQVFGPAFAGRILAAQIARTGLSSALIPATRAFTKSLDPKTVQNIVNAFRNLANKRPIYGAAAQSSFSKTLRTTGVTQVIITVVSITPDTFNVLSKKISGAQYTKNMTSALSSVGASLAASYGAGVMVGKYAKKKGETVKGAVGGAIGFAAGFAGATGANIAVRSVGNQFHEDDAVITTRLFNAVMSNLCVEYLLTEAEIDKVVEEINQESKQLRKLQHTLISSTHQYHDVEEFLREKFEKVILSRGRIDKEVEDKMNTEIDSAISEIVEDMESEGSEK